MVLDALHKNQQIFIKFLIFSLMILDVYMDNTLWVSQGEKKETT
jgi:hypothetical protein